MARISPWGDNDALEDAQPANPEKPDSWWWDDDPMSGNCALRGRDGAVLRIVIQTGQSWSIYDGETLLDVRSDRDTARKRAEEMFLNSNRLV